MEKELIKKGFIPLDKSWIIRMGILDLVNGYSDILEFLNKQKNLGDDLLALKKVATDWNTDKPLEVGESGTLYRLLKFISWKLNLNKTFVLSGTLKERKINDDKNIVNLSQNELLKLDNNTSQWSSALVLTGDVERLQNPPYKLKLTYEAVDYWKKQRERHNVWEPRFDQTILNQALTYIKIMKRESAEFIPEQAEDFCFAYIFGFMSAEEGEKRWPSLRTHESDRIIEIKNILDNAKSGKEIISKDHRVVQAIAMWAKVNNKKLNILYPEAVNKTWPQFWDFMKDY
ncbi:MAG: hypothetical protein WCV55_02625 [Candidatus Paceibacterota bacterium]